MSEHRKIDLKKYPAGPAILADPFGLPRTTCKANLVREIEKEEEPADYSVDAMVINDGRAILQKFQPANRSTLAFQSRHCHTKQRYTCFIRQVSSTID